MENEKKFSNEMFGYDKREVEKNKSINREIDSHLKMKNQY